MKAQRRVLSPDEAWASELVERILAGCHPKQRAFVEDPAMFISARVGRGGGKTTGGKARYLRRMLTQPRAMCGYAATTRGHAERLMWEPLKDTCERIGLRIGEDVIFNESKLIFTVKRTGSQLYLAGMDTKSEIIKLRGSPWDEFGVDEAGLQSAKLLEDLVDRGVGPRLRGPIWLISTPDYVLEGLFYDATRPGSDQHRPYDRRDDPEFEGWDRWSSHFWALNEPEVLAVRDAQGNYPMRDAWQRALAKKASKGWSDDNPIWRREYLGEWAADGTGMVFQYAIALGEGDKRGPAGTAWNQWDPQLVGLLGLARLPDGVADWHYVIALDQGYKDPFACNVFAFSPRDPARCLYHVFSFERTGMYARPIAELLIGKEEVAAVLAGKGTLKPGGLIGAIGWPDAMIADADEALLAELGNVYGIRIAKAEKNANYKIGAIELVNGDLVDGRLKIMKGTPLEQQLLTLQWKVDEETRMMREDKAQANHSTDTLIYGRRAVAHLFGGDTEQTSKAAQPYTDPQGLDDPPPDRPRGEFADLHDFDGYGEMWGND